MEEQWSWKVRKIVEAKESGGKMNSITIVYKMLSKINFIYTASNVIIILESGTSLFFHKDYKQKHRIQAGYSKDFSSSCQ